MININTTYGYSTKTSQSIRVLSSFEIGSDISSGGGIEIGVESGGLLGMGVASGGPIGMGVASGGPIGMGPLDSYSVRPVPL